MATDLRTNDRLTTTDPTHDLDRLNDRVGDHDARLDEQEHLLGVISQWVSELRDPKPAAGPDGEFRRATLAEAVLRAKIAELEKVNEVLRYNLQGAEHKSDCYAEAAAAANDRADRLQRDNKSLRAQLDDATTELAAAVQVADTNLEIAEANRVQLKRVVTDVTDIRQALADCACRTDTRDLRDRVTVLEMRLDALLVRLGGADDDDAAGAAVRAPWRPTPGSDAVRLDRPQPADDFDDLYIMFGEPVG